MEEDEPRQSADGGEICGDWGYSARKRNGVGRPFVFSRLYLGRTGSWAGAIDRPIWSRRAGLAKKDDRYASARVGLPGKIVTYGWEQ
jgi:hypothetical protein